MAVGIDVYHLCDMVQNEQNIADQADKQQYTNVQPNLKFQVVYVIYIVYLTDSQ